MKIVLAITSSEGAEEMAEALKGKGYRVTLMSSMGGFLRKRNTTMMIGIRDEQVEEVLGLIREHAPPPATASGWRLFGRQEEPSGSSVTVFVLDMSRSERYVP